jgi:hypothetical protein
MNEMTSADLVTLIGSLLAFGGSLIVLFVNRREAAARMKSLETQDKKIEVETDGEYQRQINDLVLKNGELFTHMETMRATYEKRLDDLEKMYEKKLQDLEKTLDVERLQNEKTTLRMSRDIMNLQNDLRTQNDALQSERERNIQLMRQMQYQEEIHKNELHRVSSDLKDVKRQTGKLPLPPEREKKETI